MNNIKILFVLFVVGYLVGCFTHDVPSDFTSSSQDNSEYGASISQ